MTYNITRCKVCGFATESFQSTEFNIWFHYCSRCQFIFKDKEDILDEKEELKIYLLHENSIEDERYLDFFQKFIDETICQYQPSGNKILDFGSGPEPVLAYLLETKYNMDVDIHDVFFSPEKVYQGKKYGGITSTEVIEHLRDPVKYFDLFKRHLQDDGYLYIMTLFHGNDKRRFLKWHYIRDMSHISFFTPKTLKYIAQLTGLNLIYTNDIRYAVFNISND